MRILLGIQRLWRGGGTETHVVTLADRLKERGHHVVLFTNGGEWVSKVRKLGIPVYIGTGAKQPSQRTLRAFRHYVRHQSFDVVHVHDGATLNLVCNAFVGHRSMPPVVFTMHGPYVTPVTLQRANRQAEAIICVSPALATVFHHRVPNVRNKVYVVSNGIRHDLFRKNQRAGQTFRKRHHISRDEFTIGYAGRFTFDKIGLGRRIVAILSSYAHQHRRVRILVAGRNSKRMIRTSHHVIVVGHVEDMRAYYNACDMLIGTARVAAEAVACEVPTIAIGKSALIGQLTPHRLKRALKTNFGDHGPSHPWQDATLRGEIERTRKADQASNSTIVRRQMLNMLSAGRMAVQVEHVYRRLLLKR